MSWLGDLIGYRPEPWHEKALCAQVGSDLWFPDKGCEGGNIREAIKTCNRCPVQAECLQYALEHGERYGIWGGITERQRRHLRRSQPPRPRDNSRCHNGHDITEVGRDNNGYCRQCRRDNLRRHDQKRRSA